MHLACVLGMIFPLHELSAWMGKQGQLPRKKCGPSALKAFWRWASLCWALCPIPQEGFGGLKQGVRSGCLWDSAEE